MDGFLDWITSNAPLVLTWIVAVVGIASFATKAVAPLTETKLDDKLAGFFSKLQSILDKLALNSKPPVA